MRGTAQRASYHLEWELCSYRWRALHYGDQRFLFAGLIRIFALTNTKCVA